MEVRVLRPSERSALLDLLDLWPFADGRRGRDVFRKYLELDPSFEERNVWVAADGDRLLSCAQIFPRRLRVRGVEVPAGGIGSVFTRPEARRRGLAEGVLAAAVEDMVERGMELSLLYAARVEWYDRLGWRPWSSRQLVLHPPTNGERTAGLAASASSVRLRDLDLENLEECAAIGAEYSARLCGTVSRDVAGWRASLDLAGNPDESFVVAESSSPHRRIVAYARATELEGDATLTEWGCRSGGYRALSRVFVEIAVRAGGKPLCAPAIDDPRLEPELTRLGFAIAERRWESLAPPTWMLRCLAPERLAQRLGLDYGTGDSGRELLARALPPEHFSFWPTDRF